MIPAILRVQQGCEGGVQLDAQQRRRKEKAGQDAAVAARARLYIQQGISEMRVAEALSVRPQSDEEAEGEAGGDGEGNDGGVRERGHAWDAGGSVVASVDAASAAGSATSSRRLIRDSTHRQAPAGNLQIEQGGGDGGDA